jgi:hypothetical protein
MENQTTPTLDLNALLLAALTPVLNQITAPLVERIAALEQRLENITTASDERIKEIAEDVAEAKMSEHTDEYDHYHMECEITNLEDKIDDKVRDAVRELSFTVTVD